MISRVTVFLLLAAAALAQTSPQSLLVTRIYSITSSWPGECGTAALDNRSQFTRQNNFHSVYVTGSGSWTAALSYSDVSCTGPWTTFGSPATLTQASALTVISAVAYHPFVRVVITGSATATYAAAKDFFPAAQGVTAVVQDLAPQLGGDLDMNGHNIQTVTPTEMGYLHGVTSAIQAQLGLKAPLASPVFTGQPTIADLTLMGHSHQNAAGGGTLDAAAIASGVLTIGRIPTGTTGTTAALGNHTHVGLYEPVITAGSTAQYLRGDKSLATFATDALAAVTWSSLTGKPSTFAPAAHASTHAAGGGDAVTLTEAQITNLTTDLAGKAPTASPTFTGTVTINSTCPGGAPAGSVCAGGTYYGDGSGLTGVGGSGAGSALTTVTFSATPTYAVSTSAVQVFKITLSGNITSATLTTTQATNGQVIAWEYCQDSTGGRTVVWPTNVLNYGSVDSTASACSKQPFLWDGSNAIAAGPMVSDVATPALITAAGTLALPTAPETLVGRATTDPLTNKTIDTANNTVKLAGTTITGKQGNTGVVVTAGTVAGTAAPLCTDASGNATTSGCPASTPAAGTGINVSGSTVSINAVERTTWQMDEWWSAAASASGAWGVYGWQSGATVGGVPTFGAIPVADIDQNHLYGIKALSPASISNGGFLALRPGAASGGIPTVALQSGTFRPIEFQFQFRIANSTPNTSNMRFIGGLTNAIAMPTAFTNGAWIRYDTTVSDTGWVAVCGDASAVATASITGTLDNNWHRGRIWSTASGTWSFSIDGGATATCSKTPATNSYIWPTFVVNNDGTSTTTFAEISRVQAQMTSLSVN